jgi:LCP family protein required for cell wall assembly
MNKAKGCFISVVVIFFIGLIVILCIALPNSKKISDENQNSAYTQNLLNFGSKNFLFLGVDEREGFKNFKGRTDTIIILHLGSSGKKDFLISIPRDVRVNLKDYGWNKINAAYEYGGNEMLNDEILKLTGIAINKYMLVNFDGFKKIIDALGGIRIVVEEPLHDPKSGANFDPGTYLMNGDQALSFARCRSTSKGDLDRADRQKYLVSELLKQKINFTIIFKAPEVIKILNEETKSDFSVIDYISLGTALLFSNKDIQRITIPTKPANIGGISYLIANEKEVRDFLSKYIGN